MFASFAAMTCGMLNVHNVELNLMDLLKEDLFGKATTMAFTPRSYRGWLGEAAVMFEFDLLQQAGTRVNKRYWELQSYSQHLGSLELQNAAISYYSSIQDPNDLQKNILADAINRKQKLLQEILKTKPRFQE